MDLKQYKAAIEAMLFAYAEPVSAEKLAEVLEIEVPVVERLLLSLRDDLAERDRGLQLLSMENRWQLSTKNEYGDYIKKALDTRRNTPLSPAALEVLAIIAYNQPVSRSFIEQVRGVDSSSTVQTLLTKGLVEEAGRLELPGHPISFKTTDVFLRTFGLSSLTDLPPLHDDDYALENTAQPISGADEDIAVEFAERAEMAVITEPEVE
ncbi:MAG: SMC-Scp complex subunit ScpB [Ruthenibacterium sp.]